MHHQAGVCLALFTSRSSTTKITYLTQKLPTPPNTEAVLYWDSSLGKVPDLVAPSIATSLRNRTARQDSLCNFQPARSGNLVINHGLNIRLSLRQRAEADLLLTDLSLHLYLQQRGLIIEPRRTLTTVSLQALSLFCPAIAQGATSTLSEHHF